MDMSIRRFKWWRQFTRIIPTINIPVSKLHLLYIIYIIPQSLSVFILFSILNAIGPPSFPDAM